MRMQLHIDSTIGDLYTYPIYDIDYSILSALPNFTVTIAPTVSQGYTINKWYVQNDTGALTTGLPASIPRKPEQNGNILQQRFAYTEELGGINYLENWFDSDYYEVLTTQPSDWNTNPNYLKIPDATGTYRYVIGKISERSETFTANSCYKDLKRMCCRKFYTNRGGHFAVYKCGSYNRTTRNTCQWAVGTPPMNWSDTTAAIQKAYMFVSDTTGEYFNSSLYISRTTDASNAGEAYNSNLIFVHYTVSGTEYYGVAEVLFNTFNDDAIPIRIMVCGIDASFWNENVIPGGGSGEGSWGPKTQPTISNGTFSGRSDSITRDPSDTHSASHIVDTVNNDVKDLFYNNNQNGYPSFNTFLMTYVDNTSVLQMLGALIDPDTWDAWDNKLYNPLSGVLGFGLVPSDFVSYPDPAIVKELWISGVDISQRMKDKYTLVAKPTFRILQTLQHKIFDPVDLRTEPWFGGFADFAPNTKMILHLPFIGEVDVNVNECMYGYLGVEYNCDLTSGNVLAYIYTVDQNDNAQYIACAEGNCMYNIPLFQTSQDGSGFGKALVGYGMGAVGLATGNIPMVIGATATMGYALNQTVTSPHEKTRSGNLGGNNCLMSPKEVWLEIIRPKWCENMFYQKLRGIPSEMSHYISDCGQNTDASGNPIPTGIAYDGYLKISEIELDGVNATDAEKEEIEALLKAGVYIRGAEL